MKGSIGTASRPAEATATRLIGTLTLAGCLAGLIIVAVVEATLPAISAHRAEALQEAVFKVLSGVTRMQRLVYRDQGLVPVTEEGSGEPAVFAGFDSEGRLRGYAIPGAGPGFQDTIALLYGYLPEERRIIGMEILESRETPGLGDKIYKDAAFVANFRALAVDPEILPVKKGRKSAPNEIDTITGATISSKAVVRILNEATRLWAPRLGGPSPGAQP